MKKVTEIDPKKDTRWNKFVENHPFGWLCHLSGWKDVLENSYNHMKGHYFVLLDTSSDNIVAGMPVYEVKSWLLGNRLVSIPYATLCDPLVSEPKDFEFLFNAAISFGKEAGISNTEIRTFHAASLIQNSFCYIPFHKHHYIILDKEPEVLKKSFHRTNVRQRIQRALNSNLEVRIADSEKDIVDFYTLYIKTRRKIGLPPQPCRFFKELWHTFSPSGNIALYLAKQEGKTLSALILFKFKNRMSAEFLASDENYLQLSPNHLLFWEAIKSASEEGYEIFDFGRTSPCNTSLMQFKDRWGTSVMDLGHICYPAKSLTSLTRESQLPYKLINSICRRSPDSICRLLGEICYKHLG